MKLWEMAVWLVFGFVGFFFLSGNKRKVLTALQTEATYLTAKLVITYRYRLWIAFRLCQDILMR